MTHNKQFLTISIVSVLLFLLIGQVFAANSPDLGDAISYLVLAGETVTNTGNTVVAGNVGVSPGSAVTGFPPGIVTPPYSIHKADESAALAQAANLAAFGFLDQECEFGDLGSDWDLTGETLTPGVYCANNFSLEGTLTLNGSATDVWIFKADAGLTTTGTNAKVIGPPDACDVWWRVVSSATLDTNTQFLGNILAHISISLGTGASLEGRAFAYTGEVTLDNNNIAAPACLPALPTPTPTAPAGPTATPSPRRTSTPEVPELPETGSGAFILNEMSPWSLVFFGGIFASALIFSVRSLRRTDRPKK